MYFLGPPDRQKQRFRDRNTYPQKKRSKSETVFENYILTKRKNLLRQLQNLNNHNNNTNNFADDYNERQQMGYDDRLVEHTNLNNDFHKEKAMYYN
jgi:hypothetical protein